MEYIEMDLEKDPNITIAELKQSPLFKEQQARYNKEWLDNMCGAAFFTAVVTTAAYYLPQIIALLDK
jgi:hypothetical protein